MCVYDEGFHDTWHSVFMYTIQIQSNRNHSLNHNNNAPVFNEGYTRKLVSSFQINIY